MSRFKKNLLAILVFCMWGLFPTVTLAGSCQCNGVIGGEAQVAFDQCVKEGSTEAIGQGIFQQNDCDIIAQRIAPTGDTSIKCIFDNTKECAGINFCNGKPCYPINETCSQDSDCTKWQLDACIGVKDCAFASACKAESCYVDNASLNRYKNTPKILNNTPSLQLSQPKFEIKLPGLNFTDLQNSIDANGNLHIPYLGEFLSYAYKLAMGIGSVVALVMLIVEGARIVVSGGGAGKTEAYQRIGQIVVGLVLLWSSYAILYSINPELVQFRALSVKYIEPDAVPDRISGGEETSDDPVVISSKTSSGGTSTKSIKLPKGAGAVAAANATACPALTSGTTFQGAFTTYHTISHDLYGQSMGYRGSYIRGSIQGLDPDMGDFYCAVFMECSCPDSSDGGNGKGPWVCQNSKGTKWRICNPFPKNANWCPNNPSKYRAGETVAASTCFPRGCKLDVNGHILTVTDVGGGIIGTHFDLYIGQVGGSDLLTDTSWLKPDIKIVDCSQPPLPKKTIETMRASYQRYAPGVCIPGKNC